MVPLNTRVFNTSIGVSFWPISRMILRWYLFLSSWVFLLSATYSLHKQNTYPLQLFCLLGLAGIPYMALTEPVLKLIFLIFAHLLPFLWLPALINWQGIQFALFIILLYGLIMTFMHKNIFELYYEILTRHHTTTYAFFQEALGF
jgi:hypothetical protein